MYVTESVFNGCRENIKAVMRGNSNTLVPLFFPTNLFSVFFRSLINEQVFRTEKNIKRVTPIWRKRLNKWKPNSLFLPRVLFRAYVQRRMGRFWKDVNFTKRLKESRFLIHGLEIRGTSSNWKEPFRELKYIPVLVKTSRRMQESCFWIFVGNITV